MGRFFRIAILAIGAFCVLAAIIYFASGQDTPQTLVPVSGAVLDTTYVNLADGAETDWMPFILIAGGFLLIGFMIYYLFFRSRNGFEKQISAEEDADQQKAPIPPPGHTQIAQILARQETQLASAQAQATRLALRFNNDFMPLFEEVVGWFIGQWTAFEEQVAGLFEVKTKLSRDISRFRPDSEISQYQYDMKQAEETLANEFRANARDRFKAQRDKRNRLVALNADKLKLEKDMRRQVIEMAGNEKVSITPVSKGWMIFRIIAFFIIVGVIEAMAGFNIFEYEGDPMTALALTTFTVLILTGWSILGGKNMAKIVAHDDTKKRFKKAHPDGTDFDGQPLELLPLNTLTSVLAVTAISICLTVSIGLLAWRFAVAASDTVGMLAGMAEYTTIALVIVTISTFFVEMVAAAKYESEYQQDWQELADRLRAIDVEIAEVEAIDDSQFERGYELAIEKYRKAAELAYNKSQERVEDLRNRCADFSALCREYKQAWLGFLRRYLDSITSLINAVFEARKDLNQEEEYGFNDRQRMLPVENLFRNSARMSQLDQDFLDKVEGFEPEVSLPDLRVGSFHEIREAIEAEVKPEFADNITGLPSRSQINPTWNAQK